MTKELIEAAKEYFHLTDEELMKKIVFTTDKVIEEWEKKKREAIQRAIAVMLEEIIEISKLNQLNEKQNGRNDFWNRTKSRS